MQTVLVDLAAALRKRREIIADEASRQNERRHHARLAAISEKIEQFEADLPRPVDPQLAHFLQRRSYDKALEFIENTTRRSAAR